MKFDSEPKDKKPTNPPATETEDIDEVEEASLESFPASDSPGWISEDPKKNSNTPNK